MQLVRFENQSGPRVMPAFPLQKSDSKKDVNLKFPYQVAFRRPAAGTVKLMDSFCRARSLPSRTREDMRGYLRYCFAKTAHAELFADEFGGDRINVATRQSPDTSIFPGLTSPRKGEST